jgi:hypothetical protein
VRSPDIGSDEPDRIEANFNVFDFELTHSDLASIDAVDHGTRIGGNRARCNSSRGRAGSGDTSSCVVPESPDRTPRC